MNDALQADPTNVILGWQQTYNFVDPTISNTTPVISLPRAGAAGLPRDWTVYLQPATNQPVPDTNLLRLAQPYQVRITTPGASSSYSVLVPQRGAAVHVAAPEFIVDVRRVATTLHGANPTPNAQGAWWVAVGRPSRYWARTGTEIGAGLATQLFGSLRGTTGRVRWQTDCTAVTVNFTDQVGTIVSYAFAPTGPGVVNELYVPPGAAGVELVNGDGVPRWFTSAIEVIW